METQFSLFDLLILIGISQGVITGILLLVSKKNSRSNRFLAFALFAFCFLSTKVLLLSTGLWDTQVFRYFPNGVEVLLPPLVYFYVFLLIEPDFEFKPKHFLHFLPFVISQSYAFWVYFSLFNIEDLAQKDLLANAWYFNHVKAIEDHVSLLSTAIYLLFGYKKLKAYKVWLNDSISDNAYPDFNWLKNVFILSSILGIFLCVNLALNQIFPDDSYRDFRWQGYSVFIAFLIYYLGFVGYRQPDLVHRKSAPIAKPVKKISFTQEKQEAVAKSVKHAFETEKVFLNPTLNIQDLSQKLNFPQRTISQVINNFFEKSFRDLVNEYRVEEVKAKLQDKSYEHLSMLGIALECGFNSEATFYRIFKKNTGLSPKEYLSMQSVQ